MLDSTSLEILNILQQKARIPNIEVSRQVGLAPSAVLERIRKMENQGVIIGNDTPGANGHGEGASQVLGQLP